MLINFNRKNLQQTLFSLLSTLGSLKHFILNRLENLSALLNGNIKCYLPVELEQLSERCEGVENGKSDK